MNDIQVKVQVGILLARYSKFFEGGNTEAVLDVSPGTTLADIVNIIGIPRSYISFPLVNGERADFSLEVKPGDKIIYLPYIVGG